MLAECIEGLQIKPDGTYVDATFGGGGHSAAIAQQLRQGKLYSFDQDPEAWPNADALQQLPVQLVKANFRHVERYLRLHGIRQVDGLLADLGVSSHQIDTSHRGFSTRYDGRLDMRMDPSAPKTAAEILNTYSERDLHAVLGKYGEVRNAKTLAAAIVSARTHTPIETGLQFKAVLEKLAPRNRQAKYMAQVFQALRIVVNDELGALEALLQQCANIIKPGGRLVVMSYHSLEDRLVKHFISSGNFEGAQEKDFYGNVLRPFEPVTRKPVSAQEQEVEENPRARSARLRIAVKS